MKNNDLTTVVDLLEESITKLKELIKENNGYLPDNVSEKEELKDYLYNVFYPENRKLADIIVNTINENFSLKLLTVDSSMMSEEIIQIISDFRFENEFKEIKL
jgi:hypothetical protein